MSFVILLGLGTVYLVCFAGLVWHHGKTFKFETAHLGLLTLATALIAIGLLEPDSFSSPFGKFERLRAEAEVINKKAADSLQKAEESTRLALETVAILTWNDGRTGNNSSEKQEELATDILKSLHGDKALQYRYALQHQGILRTPQAELKKLPKGHIPPDLDSPLYETYLRGISADRK